MTAPWTRALLLSAVIALVLTTLVPLGSLANLAHGTGAPGSGTDPTQVPHPGAASPQSGNDYATLSIDPPSAILLAGMSQVLTAHVVPVSVIDPVVVQDVLWVLLNASGAGSLTPTDSLSTTLTAESPSSPVNATAQVTVTGYAVLGFTGSFTLTATAAVTLVPALEAGPLSASPDPATPGTPVLLSLPITGGLPPYQVHYRFGDGTRGLSFLPATGTAVVSHPYALGSYLPQANVTDALGEVVPVTAEAPVLVGDALLVAVEGPVRSDVGVPVTFTASVTGGTPPYAYTWQSSQGTGSVQGQNFTVDPLNPGPLGISLVVHDSAGGSTQAPTVIDSVAPLPTLTLSSDPAEADVGFPLPETLTLQGGTPPYAVEWEPYLGGPSLEGSFPAPGSYPEPFTVPDPGPVVMTGSARDASGVAFSASSEVARILPDPEAYLTGPSLPSATGSPFTLTGTVSGGQAPYRWWLAFSSPVTASTPEQGSLASAGSLWFRGTLQTAGAVIATLTVQDADGANASSSFTLTGVEPLSATFLGPLPAAEVGLPVSFPLLLAGGTPPYRVEVQGSDGVSLPLGPVPAGLLEVPWVPRLAGRLGLLVSVEDADGSSAYANATVTVVPPVRGSLDLPSAQTDVGPFTLSVGVQGGLPPYTGTLNVSGGPAVAFSGAGGTFPETLDLLSPGPITLVLQVTDALGARALSSATLSVDPRPQVSLDLSSQRVDVGETLQASLVVQGGTGPWQEATIDFGDGSAPAPTPAGHTYSTAGTYTVSAQLVDATGTRANATPLSVTVVPDPSALSSLRQAGVDAGLAAAFDSTVSFGVPPYTYAWEFGDGTGSSEADPTHVYTVPGFYQVTLTITDSQGTITSAPPLNVTVAPSPTLLIQSNQSTPEVGEPVLLSAVVLGGAPPEDLAWTFPDLSGSGGSAVSYLFPQAGTQTVRVVLTDGAGAQVASSLTLDVAPALTLGPVLTPFPAAEVGVSLPLTAQPLGGVAPLTYRWQLGPLVEEGPGLGQLDYTPETPGPLNGTLVVSDAVGARVFQSVNLPVVPHLTVGLAASDIAVDDGTAVSFAATATGGYGNLSYRWQLPAGLSSSAQGPLATASPSTPGRYVIGLTVEDALGATAESSLVLTVDPVLSLTVSLPGPTTDVGLPTPVTASIGGGTSPYASGWDLPSGASVLPSGALLFSRPGDFRLQAWARDQTGALAQASVNISVLPAPSPGPWSGPSQVPTGVPEAYSWTPEGGTAPWDGNLLVLGVGDFPGLSANVTFPRPGDYTVVAQAEDASGASLSSVFNVTARSDPLALQVSVPDPFGLSPFLSSVTVTVQGGVGAVEGIVQDNGTGPSGWSLLPPDGIWNLSLPVDAPGDLPVTVAVRDSLGRVVEQTVTLEGLASPPVPTLTVPSAQAGAPETLLAGWPGGWASPGEVLSGTWWGPGVTGARGDEATFQEDRGGSYPIAFSVDVLSPDRTLLTNLTVYAREEVSPGPGVALSLAPLAPQGFAGQNVSLPVAVVDAFGNVNTTAAGNVSLQAWQGGGPAGGPEVAPLQGGWARLLLSREQAGNLTYVVTAPGVANLSFHYSWLADPEDGVLRVVSWSLHDSTLLLDVSASDIFGNPLSGYPVTAEAPGLAPVSGVTVGGRVTLLLPGGASALEVNVTGPYGASTTVLLPGPASPPPDPLSLVLLALFLGGVLGSGLFFHFRARRRKRSAPSGSPPDPLLSQVEATPGEEAESLGAMARMKGWSGEDATRDLVDLEEAGKVHREADPEGKDRYFPGPPPPVEEPSREDAP